MSDFLNSVKADLLGRRMLPLVVALGVALLAAIAYAALGGSTAATPPRPHAAVPHAVGISITEAPSNPNQSVAETTNGTTVQRKGNTRNPFASLAAATVKASTTSTGKTSSAPSTTKEAGSGTSSKGTSGGSTPSKPSAPSTPRIVIHFHVAAQFGVLPPPPAPGAPQPPAQLKGFENMTVDQPLPGKDNPQVVFLGVMLPSGKGAVFALTGEPILHGKAKCLPSPTQCQAIELLPGQSETLTTFDANNNSVTYELKLVSIKRSRTTAATASVKSAFKGPSKAQRELLRRAGLALVPTLRGAQGANLLVFAPRHRATSRHARTAAQRRRRG